MTNVFDFRFMGSAKEYLEEFWGSTSIGQVMDCPLCNGEGHYAVQENAEDFINIECSACNGTGKIIAATI